MKVRLKVMERTGNRCERCDIDFDSNFKGEFHHIIPIVKGGKNTIENCSLLCKNCHDIAPNIKYKQDFLIYKNYFLRFASFKEASQYYGVKTRIEQYNKIAKDIVEICHK